MLSTRQIIPASELGNYPNLVELLSGVLFPSGAIYKLAPEGGGSPVDAVWLEAVWDSQIPTATRIHIDGLYGAVRTPLLTLRINPATGLPIQVILGNNGRIDFSQRDLTAGSGQINVGTAGSFETGSGIPVLKRQFSPFDGTTISGFIGLSFKAQYLDTLLGNWKFDTGLDINTPVNFTSTLYGYKNFPGMCLGPADTSPGTINFNTTLIAVPDFSKNSVAGLCGGCLMPLNAKINNTTIYPVVHWAATDTAIGNVSWGFEYVILNPGTAVPISSGTVVSLSVTNGVAWAPKATYFAPINIAALAQNSQIGFRIFRDGPVDTYPTDVCLAFSVGFYYPLARIGATVIV